MSTDERLDRLERELAEVNLRSERAALPQLLVPTAAATRHVLDRPDETFSLSMQAMDARIAEFSTQTDGDPAEWLVEVARLMNYIKGILEFVVAIQQDLASHRGTNTECLNNLCSRVEAIENVLRRSRVALETFANNGNTLEPVNREEHRRVESWQRMAFADRIRVTTVKYLGRHH